LNTKERSIKVVKELNDAASFIQSLQTDYCYLIKANNEITKARDIFAKENAVFKAENEALREFVEMFECLRKEAKVERLEYKPDYDFVSTTHEHFDEIEKRLDEIEKKFPEGGGMNEIQK